MFKVKKLFEKDWYFRKYVSILSCFVHSEKVEEIRLIHNVKLVYNGTFKKRLHLKHPANLNEKLIWLSLYWRHPLKSICADKVKVRDYVASKGLAHLLTPVIGIYKIPEEIPYESLPERFVLKCNHGCGYNIIVKEKDILNTKIANQTLNAWLSNDYKGGISEIHYRDIAPHLIICEEFLGDEAQEWMIDYKIHCINGEPEYIQVCYDRDVNGIAQRASYSVDWEPLYYYTEAECSVPRPSSLQEMINSARLLSKDFPYVRVDFYDVKGKAILSELTFTPFGNMIYGVKDSVMIQLGKKLNLPKKYINK